MNIYNLLEQFNIKNMDFNGNKKPSYNIFNKHHMSLMEEIYNNMLSTGKLIKNDYIILNDNVNSCSC